MRPIKDRLLEKVSFPSSGCWIFTASKDWSGYGKISTSKNQYDRAHRVSWRLFRGEIPEGKCVLHKCDVRECINPSHLFLGTRMDNAADMIAKGRKFTKLKEGDVKKIKQDTRLLREIASEYGTCIANVSLIKLGKRWNNV